MTAVMIVEDDDEIRELLAEMLADRGHLVSIARHGKDALELLRSKPQPNIMLLDLMMPVMDGWKMRAEMLADSKLAAIPVIILSGAADLQDGSEVLKAARVLTKPVKWRVLLESIRDHASG